MASYWIVDPAEPSKLALDLVDGTYTTTTEASGTDRATIDTPLPIEVVPADLVASAP